MGRKVLPTFDSSGDILIGWTFPCPGCESYHCCNLPGHPNRLGAVWQATGTPECPTFSPSIKQVIEFTESDRPDKICHLTITDGRISFLSDSTHSLAGKTVMMEDLS